MPEIGINPNYDHLFDPQQARVVGRCIYCGRELYSMFSDTCDRCLFDMELEED